MYHKKDRKKGEVTVMITGKRRGKKEAGRKHIDNYDGRVTERGRKISRRIREIGE